MKMVMAMALCVMMTWTVALAGGGSGDIRVTTGAVGAVSSGYRDMKGFLVEEATILAAEKVGMSMAGGGNSGAAVVSAMAISGINEATVELSSTISDGFFDHLGSPKCKANVQPMQTSLVEAGELLESGDVTKAREQIHVVINLLEDCLNSISHGSNMGSTTMLAKIRSILGHFKTGVSKLFPLHDTNASNSMDSFETNSVSSANAHVDVNNYKQNKNVDTVPINNGPNFVKTRSETNTIKPTFSTEYCGNHVALQSNTATITLDQSCGAKIKSTGKYTSGVFSARIKTPVNGAGIINSFYISSNDQRSDLISFDFIGKYPNRVLTSYSVNGNSAGNHQMFVFEFDNSVDFHIYTIKWDSHSIMWIVDNIVVRTIYRAQASSGYPNKPGHILFHTWDASTIADGSYAGKINWMSGPFRSYFTDITVASPSSWRAPDIADSDASLSPVPVPLKPLAIDYCFNNVGVGANDISISYDKYGCGGRFRSITTYKSGTFTGQFKCASGDTSGLLSSFYLSSLEGSKVQDEIDFEWLGKDKMSVQTNYYVNGVGGHEVMVPLGFDCSEAFHTYTIIYNLDNIQWLIDGKIVRIVTRANEVQRKKPYPVKPVYLYGSIWNASGVSNGHWTGKWQGTNLPYTISFSDISITSA